MNFGRQLRWWNLVLKRRSDTKPSAKSCMHHQLLHWLVVQGRKVERGRERERGFRELPLERSVAWRSWCWYIWMKMMIQPVDTFLAPCYRREEKDEEALLHWTRRLLRRRGGVKLGVEEVETGHLIQYAVSNDADDEDTDGLVVGVNKYVGQKFSYVNLVKRETFESVLSLTQGMTYIMCIIVNTCWVVVTCYVLHAISNVTSLIS